MMTLKNGPYYPWLKEQSLLLRKLKRGLIRAERRKEEDVSRDYLSGDPLYLESDDKNSDNYSSVLAPTFY